MKSPFFPVKSHKITRFSYKNCHGFTRHTLAGGFLAGTRVRLHHALETQRGVLPAGCCGAAGWHWRWKSAELRKKHGDKPSIIALC